MKEGDFIVGIGDKDVKWAPHEEVVALIKASGNNLNLRIVTPVDKRHTAIGKVVTCADRIDLLGRIIKINSNALFNGHNLYWDFFMSNCTM